MAGVVEYVESVRSSAPCVKFEVWCYHKSDDSTVTTFERKSFAPSSHWSDSTATLNLLAEGFQMVHLVTREVFLVSPATASMIDYLLRNLYRQNKHRDANCEVSVCVETPGVVEDQIVILSSNGGQSEGEIDKPWVYGSFWYYLLIFFGFGLSIWTYAAALTPVVHFDLVKKFLLEDSADPLSVLINPVSFSSLALRSTDGEEYPVGPEPFGVGLVQEMMRERLPAQTDPFYFNTEPLTTPIIGGMGGV